MARRGIAMRSTLVPHPLPSRHSAIEHGPVNRECQGTWVAQAGNRVRDKAQLDRERVQALIIEQAPQPLETVALCLHCHTESSQPTPQCFLGHWQIIQDDQVRFPLMY